MSRIIIIPCGSKKIFDKDPSIQNVKAEDLYIGSYHLKCKEFAKYIAEYCILSAKYGFLFPDDIIIDNYNVTFNDKKTDPIKVSQLKEQLYKFDKYNIIECACGKKYHDIIEKAFGREIFNYLVGFKGMGYQMKYMTDYIRNDKGGNFYE